MKKIMMSIAFSCVTLFVFGQWQTNGSTVYHNSGKVGIGTSTPAAKLEVSNSGYTGFFITETSGTATGAAQLRFRANVVALVFDDPSGAQQGMIGFNNSSNNIFFKNEDNGDIFFETGGSHVLKFTAEGKLGINTGIPDETLSVNGVMECEKAKVVTDVADYVFDEGYHLLSLEELEGYIKSHGHLPNIQTQEDVDHDKGRVDLGALSVSLMEKVEELTLHLIEINKRMNSLEDENESLKSKIALTEKKSQK